MDRGKVSFLLNETERQHWSQQPLATKATDGDDDDDDQCPVCGIMRTATEVEESGAVQVEKM